MDGRRHHNGMHSSLPSQQYPPPFQQGSGHPLPFRPPSTGFTRPPSLSGPLGGQKRNGCLPDTGICTKLFVASLPRNMTEDEVRELFGGFGNVLEVIFLKDKKTGLPQGCCFIKYANIMEAQRAIRALDNQRTLPGGPAPLQVKLAVDEYDHSGHTEYKLFVGSLNRQAGEEDIEKIFGPYGQVENVYVIRDEQKQSRGCAFVTFPERDMAIAAISALNGIYKMAGCHQPIIVRFADPKRPRSMERETRMGAVGTEGSPRYRRGGSEISYSTHSNFSGGGSRDSRISATEGYTVSFGWRNGGTGSTSLSSQAGILPLAVCSSAPTKTSHLDSASSALVSSEALNQKPGQSFGRFHASQLATQLCTTNASQASQWQATQEYPVVQSTDTKLQQNVSVGQITSLKPTAQAQICSQSPVYQPPSHQHFVTAMQSQISVVASQPLQNQVLHVQDSRASQQSTRHLHHSPHILQPQPLQPQLSKEGPQQTYNQPVQIAGHSNQPVTSQPSCHIPVQKTTPSQQQQVPAVPHRPVMSQSQTVFGQQQAGPAHQQVSPVQMALPSQQILSAQQQPIAFQTQVALLQKQPSVFQPQAALSQQLACLPQQQASLLQQQTIPFHQQAISLQQANVSIQQQASSSVTMAPSVSVEPAATLTSCDWTEHTSPEGHKYYYNSKTGESRWEKPGEFAASEQQQQQSCISQTPQQSQQQPQQNSQLGEAQIQAQHANLHHLQQPYVNHQSHYGQPYQQQLQPQLQQQHYPHLQQLPQRQQAQQQVQYLQTYPQQPKQEAQLNSNMTFSQVPTNGSQQGIQGYARLQQQINESTLPSENTAVDALKTTQVQQASSSQQILAMNSVVDAGRVVQWMPIMQQGSLNQDWMWKTKAAGS